MKCVDAMQDQIFMEEIQIWEKGQIIPQKFYKIKNEYYDHRLRRLETLKNITPNSQLEDKQLKPYKVNHGGER